MPQSPTGESKTATTTTPSSEKVAPVVPLQLDLRDYFAGRALQGFIASMPSGVWSETLEGMRGFKRLSKEAYEAADAMLEARTKGADQ